MMGGNVSQSTMGKVSTLIEAHEEYLKLIKIYSKIKGQYNYYARNLTPAYQSSIVSSMDALQTIFQTYIFQGPFVGDLETQTPSRNEQLRCALIKLGDKATEKVDHSACEFALVLLTILIDAALLPQHQTNKNTYLDCTRKCLDICAIVTGPDASLLPDAERIQLQEDLEDSIETLGSSFKPEVGVVVCPVILSGGLSQYSKYLRYLIPLHKGAISQPLSCAISNLKEKIYWIIDDRRKNIFLILIDRFEDYSQFLVCHSKLLPQKEINDFEDLLSDLFNALLSLLMGVVGQNNIFKSVCQQCTYLHGRMKKLTQQYLLLKPPQSTNCSVNAIEFGAQHNTLEFLLNEPLTHTESADMGVMRQLLEEHKDAIERSDLAQVELESVSSSSSISIH